MQVVFESSPDDIANLNYWRKRLVFVFGSLLTISLATLPAAWVLYLYQAWLALWIAEGALAVLIIVLLCQEAPEPPDPLLVTGRTMVTLKPRDLRVESELGWAEWDWSWIGRLAESKHSLRFKCGDVCLPRIPKAAFASQEVMEAFCLEARSLIAGGAKLSEPCYVPEVPQPRASVNPHLPGDMQVTFQKTTSESWLYETPSDMQHRGNMRVVQRLAGAIVCALLGWGILHWFQAGQGVAQIVVACIAFILIFFASMLFAFVLLETWSHWFAAGNAGDRKTLTVSAAGLHCAGQSWMAFARWAYISRVALDAENVVFFDIRPIPKLIVPVQAFSNAAAAEEFVRAVRTFMGADNWQQWSKYFPPEIGDCDSYYGGR